MYLTMYLSKKSYFILLSDRGRETERIRPRRILLHNMSYE